ncbi:RHS repeat domain-containing protein [Bradyrhizobium yuanmingense]|uniref:RHS repeat domain-containing protein n=1 Tax=Bradyrhizobium yuanmingense TaxID=108015 RepID=UPI0023B98DEC|nr:RHS repeat domain-containing protein [Bradyrhizobium yuanmingense]MDF0584162.1 hypothetical protein [Bradyrhizobium yuanmingense]
MKRAAVAIVLASLGAVWSGSALAQSSGTRSSGFSYDPATGLITQEVAEPGSPSLRLQTDYAYDAFGNKTSATVSGVDIVTRTESRSYDAQGRFVTSITNALGHGVSWQYDPRFGTPTSHTDPNGLTTTWSYDGSGRIVMEIRPNGTRTIWHYAYCSGIAGGTASCPAGSAYLVRATPLAADGVTQVGPTATNYHDQLGRIVASDGQGFDGSPIRVATQYDALGRVAQKSRPFFVTGGVPRWHTYTYDVLDRPITETAPDNSVLQRTHQGLVSTETNTLNQTVTTVRNSQGGTVLITDALNQTTRYVYDAFGNLQQVRDPSGNLSTFTYDARGRKTYSSSPDLGGWSYGYNVVGEVTSQTDAKGQVTSQNYDVLGRPTQRIEVGLTSSWTYDAASHGIGKLSTASTNGGYQRTHAYDILGRPTQVQITADGTTHTITTAYDDVGRVAAVTYPSGLVVGYAYNGFGFQTQLKDNATNQVLWAANAHDAELRLIRQTAGNGVVTERSYDANNGRLSTITAGNAGAVRSYTYTYDALGNMLNRADANGGISESFGYDALNRLTSATIGAATKTFAYDGIGNLLSKSDVGTYSYPAAGQPRPHGVTSISGGTLSATFTYDPNGNQTAGAGLTVNYTSFNRPADITRGTTTLSLAYDPEHERFRQTGPGGATLYLKDDAASNVMVERFSGVSGQLIRWSDYLFAGGMMVGVRIELGDGTSSTRYFHSDHLGSIAAITDEIGAVSERLAYDAWGKRRHLDGSDDPTGSIVSQATRGYTEHEMLSDVGLINMNARVYDPKIARFTSADTMVPDPINAQSWNRYAYVTNNPLRYTDPTGHQSSPLITLAPIYVCACSVSGGYGGGFGGFGYGLNFGGYGYGYSYGSGGGSYYSVPAPAMLYLGGGSPTQVTAFSLPRYDLFRLAGVVAGDVWSDTYDPARDAQPGGAGAAVNTSAYKNADSEMLPPVEVTAPSTRRESKPIRIAAENRKDPSSMGKPLLEGGGGGRGGGYGGSTSGGRNPWVPAAESNRPNLQRIHPDSTYERGTAKYDLDQVRKMSTEDIVKSLAPNARSPLVVKPDGRIFDGNTRVKVLEERGFDINSLPRVVIE